jgi:hypothetical protein
MGAIFNTQKTLAILKFLNHHYEPGTQFDKARTNQENIILRNFPSFGDGFSCAKKLGLNDTSVSSRWKKWLDFLDAHQQGFEFGGPLVRKMMADALEDPNCNGIEFFAVPAPDFFVHSPPPKVADPSDASKYTIEIIVETNTIDNMVSFTKAQKRRKK